MSVSIVSNRISTVVPPEVLQAAIAQQQAAVDTLRPYLVALGTMDRRKMPRLGDKNEVFVLKTLAYATSNPEFMPTFVDVGEFKKDVDVMQALRPVVRLAVQFVDLLNDTIGLAGSEALQASLPYYSTTKTAAKMGQPIAMTIAADLGAQFQSQGRSQGSGTTGEPPEEKA
jgi:hypothetical protein